MRKLTRKQKKILDGFAKYALNVDDLPNETWEKLQEINNTEVLQQNVNNYLWDHYYEESE
jgi:hypothetical protein